MSLADSLPSEERIAFYRKKAEETLLRAQLAPDPDTHNGLLNLAAGWHNLATELERFMEHRGVDAAEAPRKTPPQN